MSRNPLSFLFASRTRRTIFWSLVGSVAALAVIWWRAGIAPWTLLSSIRRTVRIPMEDGSEQLRTFWFDFASLIPQGNIAGAVLALWLSALALVIVLAIVRRLMRLNLPIQIPALAIARTTIDDTLGRRGTIVVLALLLLAISFLPISFKPDLPLRYRVQGFLSYSLLATSLLLSVFTVIVGCRAIASELRSGLYQQIFSKPVSKFQYLLGKFVGLAVMNAVIVGVIGVSIFLTTRLYVARGMPLDDFDFFAVQDQVLIAREAIKPRPPQPLEDIAQQRFERLVAENTPEYVAGVIYNAGSRQALMKQLTDEVRTSWMSIAPFSQQTYIFENIRPPANAEVMQLRVKAESPGSAVTNRRGITLEVNGRTAGLDLLVDKPQVYDFPVSVLEDGKLTLTIINRHPVDPRATAPVSISFASGGMELLYQVGDFGPNLARGLGFIYVRLVFLSVLGVVLSALFNFPVAAVTGLTILVIAAGSSYVKESLDYAPLVDQQTQQISAIYALLVIPLVTAITNALTEYARVDAASHIVEGRVLTNWALLKHVLVVGVGWTAVTFAIGYALFLRRELAKETSL